MGKKTVSFLPVFPVDFRITATDVLCATKYEGTVHVRRTKTV